jgi:hypothetical protein
VPKKPKNERPVLVGRYNWPSVLAEIKTRRDRGPRGTHKALSLALKLDTTQQLSHRLQGRYDTTLEEIGVIADFFDAPIGWPFIPWAIAEKLAIKK